MANEFYLCPPLLSALNDSRKVKIIIAGRGIGKTTYAGWEMYNAFAEMPQSLGAFSGPSYAMILSKMFPSAKKVLRSMGLKEDRPGERGHFTIGRKPPAHFKTPLNEPVKWEYVLCLWNGAALEFVSQDRPSNTRGASYDYHINDEAVLLKRDFHDQVLIPTLRGNRSSFEKKARFGMQCYVSSQAHTQAGYWVEDMRWLRNDRGDFLRDSLGNLVPDQQVFHARASSFENIAVLGREVLERWKRSLPAMIYDIEIMANRPEKVANGFYPAFDAGKHTYQGGYEYDYDKHSEFGMVVRREDADRDLKKGLLLSSDFNAVQNTLLVGQEVPKGRVMELRIQNEYYSAGNQDVETWLRPFVAAYKAHPHKVIELYGDPGGNKVANMDHRSLYDKMADYLRAAGWVVNVMVKRKAYPNHIQKQKFINRILGETERGLPQLRIHYTRCPWLISSLENTPILPTFQKDKSSEREAIDQRAATHGGDTLDYLLWYRYRKGKARASLGGGLHFGGKSG